MERETIRNNLRASRSRLGMSQQQLADAAGVARQTIGGIESGQYAATTAVALRLARALGTTVEDLFWLESGQPSVAVEPWAPAGDPPAPTRALAARIRGRWTAHPLNGERAFRVEVVPADATLVRQPDGAWSMELLDDPEASARTVLVAGCAPVLSLWARSAERWHPGVRVHWLHANSTESLDMLRAGVIHAAGIHFHATDEGNAARVSVALPGRPVVLVRIGTWREGILVRPRNPLSIGSPADLARRDVRIVNREPGAGSRTLLEQTLQAAGATAATVNGWESVVRSHYAVAEAVAAGRADAGMSTESMAALFGLDFVSLAEVRYDVAVLEEDLSEPHVREFVATLDHRWVRSQLRLLGGMDTARTGEIERL